MELAARCAIGPTELACGTDLPTSGEKNDSSRAR